MDAALVIDAGLWWLGALPLDIPPGPVRPVRSNGMAIYVIAAMLILGLLILVMMWVSSKPRSRRRP
jgi:hypothetical protein